MSTLALIRVLLACWSIIVAPTDVLKVVDGDTFYLRPVQVWPGIGAVGEKVRVLYVDTPELRTGPLADSAKAFTARWLQVGDFTLNACSRDSFGRLLATVTRNGRSLADTLISSGLGVPYR